LKKTQTVDKSIANKSKEELGELIKAEKETYKALEKEDRSRVLDDITEGEYALKKTKTKDKTKLKKKDIAEQIKQEKESQKIDEAQSKVLADVGRGDQKLTKVETVDKTKLPEKAALAAQIKQEKTRTSYRKSSCQCVRICIGRRLPIEAN